jgi:hypothetical protein
MSDTFAFRSAPVPLWQRIRRIDRRAVKAGLLAFVLFAGTVRFADWVIQSERASFVRAAARDTSIQIGVIPGGLVTAPASTPASFTTEDRRAQHALRRALDAARSLFRGHGTFADAGPAQLGSRVHGVTFTDGPSPVPQIVSVASSNDAWAAAARSTTGSCFEISIDGHGRVRLGTSAGACIGTAALRAGETTWRAAA